MPPTLPDQATQVHLALTPSLCTESVYTTASVPKSAPISTVSVKVLSGPGTAKQPG